MGFGVRTPFPASRTPVFFRQALPQAEISAIGGSLIKINKTCDNNELCGKKFWHE